MNYSGQLTDNEREVTNLEKVLIILGNHSPDSSSVANCMNPLIEKMSNTFSIDIITNRKRNDIPEYEKENNINIYRIDDYRVMNNTYLNELRKIESSPLLTLVTRLFFYILNFFYFIRYVLFAREKITGGWEKKRVLDKILELDRINNYKIVISASQPFQSHYIAEEFKDIKGDKLKWLAFQFDPFSLNTQIQKSRILQRKMFNDEKRIFSKCDEICLTPELFDYYKKIKKFSFLSKANILPYSNLNSVEINQENVTNLFLKPDKINCLFTGRLYEDIRNPKIMLESFSALNKNVQLTLITDFPKDKIKELTPKNLEPAVIPFQNRDTALFNMMKADILINVGNTVEHQVPAKIFEYMSTGKPIIHFSKIKNDPSIKYFEKYPNVLIVEEWKFFEVDYKSKIIKFCEQNLYNDLTLEQVSTSLEEYSAIKVQNKFMSIINEMINE